MVEGLFLCHPLTKRITGADIFHVIDFYFTEKKIKWSKCCLCCVCGLSTDGGKSMLACYSGPLCVLRQYPLSKMDSLL